MSLGGLTGNGVVGQQLASVNKESIMDGVKVGAGIAAVNVAVNSVEGMIYPPLARTLGSTVASIIVQVIDGLKFYSFFRIAQSGTIL